MTIVKGFGAPGRLNLVPERYDFFLVNIPERPATHYICPPCGGPQKLIGRLLECGHEAKRNLACALEWKEIT